MSVPQTSGMMIRSSLSCTRAMNAKNAKGAV